MGILDRLSGNALRAGRAAKGVGIQQLGSLERLAASPSANIQFPETLIQQHI
jgi:hypothetical protein